MLSIIFPKFLLFFWAFKQKLITPLNNLANAAKAINMERLLKIYIGIKRGNKTSINKYLFKNKGRFYIQKTTTKKCLELILSTLK